MPKHALAVCSLLFAFSLLGCRSSVMPPEQPDDTQPPAPGAMSISAQFDRAAQQLSITVHHADGEGVNVAIEEPAWVEIVGMPKYRFTTGNGTLTLNAVLGASDCDVGTVAVSAVADDGAQAFTDVQVVRPPHWLFIEDASVKCRGLVYEVTAVVRAAPNSTVTVSVETEKTLKAWPLGECYLVSVDNSHERPPGVNTWEQTKRGGGTFTLAFQAYRWLAEQHELTVLATDDQGNQASRKLNLALGPKEPEFKAKPDTLYAIALTPEVRVGEPALVSIVSGETPNLFLGFNSITVTFSHLASYVDFTMEYGSAGGEWQAYFIDNEFFEDPHLDGIWAAINPVYLSSCWLDCSETYPWDLGDGRCAMDFGTYPSTGKPVMCGGEIFNFQVVFDQPGTVSLGFLDEWAYYDDFFVRMTKYYGKDTYPTVYREWADITNDHPGIPNTITVTDE
jgi:hypothetical protein